MEIDLSNPAASGGGEGESLVGRNKADRGPVRRARKGPGLAVHRGRRPAPRCSSRAPSRRAARSPARSSRPTSRRCRPPTCAPRSRPRSPSSCRGRPTRRSTCARWPSRRCASWPRTSASTSRPAPPTGPNGTVTRADVEAAASGSGGGASAAGRRASLRPARREPGERETREPIKGVRKMMGQAMVDSAFTIPHVTEWITVDVTRTMEFVDRLKARREFRDVKVSPLLVLARAVMLAMRRTPEINSYWDAVGPGGRAQALREPRHRRGHAARPRRARTSRTRRTCPCSSWRAR